jgi:molecular chaperone HtpG
MKETKEFATESKELLSLMINSIYTNKDIFLRELISNASDAIDKYRFMAFQRRGQLPPDRTCDHIGYRQSQARSLSISDNGIGMDKEGSHFRSWARSPRADPRISRASSKKPKKSRTSRSSASSASASIAPSWSRTKSSVLTKKPGAESAYLFVSDGVKDYTVEEAKKDE